MKIQAQREEEILQKIKLKMDRIKANQQKLQPALTAPKQHFQGKSITKKMFFSQSWTLVSFNKILKLFFVI